MKIKLDGKDNIFDLAYRGLPDNNSKGKTSEEEKKEIIKIVNKKVNDEYNNKPIFTMDGYTKDTDYLAATPEKSYNKGKKNE